MASEIPIRLPEPDRASTQKNSRSARTVTFTLTLPKLFFSILFLAGILIWVFIFGIMLGRGHKPEKVVPELARVMPTPQAKNATSLPIATASAAGRSGNQTAPASLPAATQASGALAAKPAGVLPPQDLQYHDTLKGRPTASPVPSSSPPKPAATAKQAAAPVKATAKDAKTTPTKSEPKTAAVAKKITEKPTAKSAEQPAAKTVEPSFNYVYQVAAFKDSPSAEALRKKLQAAGITTRVEKDSDGGTTWYKLLTPFRGRPEDTRSLRQKLSDQGINRVILRSKVPVR